VRATFLALMASSLWACATAIDNAPPDSQRSQSETGGDSNAGSGTDANAGRPATAGGGGAPGAAGNGTSGATQHGGAPGSSGSAGRAGSGSGGSGNAGSAGKGGSNSAGTSSAGASNAGTSAGGSSSAGASSAGSAGTSAGSSSSAGASSGGSGSTTTCDAAHAVATVMTSQVYTGKANDCVRLKVDTSWSVINVQLQPQPGTQGYPVPFSFFSCGGNGTGSLTADYQNSVIQSGANPGCDYFVQFGGGETTIKVTYYD